MRAYVQRKANGDFPNINFAIAYDGLQKMGWEIINYTRSEQLTEVRKEDLFVGFVEDTKLVLQTLNVQLPTISCYPDELEKYYGRKIWKSTLHDFIRENNFNTFIKPVENKFFTGKLVKTFSDLISIGHQENNVEIWCSKPVEIITECRCFIKYGSVIDIRNYTGSWKSKPDVELIEKIAKNFSPNLNGYAIDFGVTKEGKTIVVEVNDGYSLGNFGLFSVDYCKLLNARWTQIMNTEDILAL